MSAIYGLLLQVDGPDSLRSATEAARVHNLRPIDAFSPFPVEGLTEAMGQRPSKIPWIMLIWGIVGALLAFGTMAYSAVGHYPFVVGGRPLFSWPAFVPISFELAILFAALAGAFCLVWFSRLPRLYHPVFNDQRFRDDAQAGFFLLLPDSESSRKFLTEGYPGAWEEVAK